MKSHLQVDQGQMTTPAGAGSLRFSEFRRLLGLRETWLWIGGPVGALLLLGLLLRKPSAALLLPLGGLAIGLGVVLWIADRNAANAFWEVYARSRGYELGGRTRLPESTPLLREGYESYATRTLDGQLVPGLFGTVALFTYEEETVGPTGRVETSYHDFTLAIVEVPECAPYIGELYAQARRGPRPLSKFGDAFRRGRRRVTLESEALDKRFEILVADGQDEIWTRRLFSPAFVVWLAESPPRKLSFELDHGTLVVYLPDHREKAKDLDELAASAGAIARRLLEESAETSSRGRLPR
jgi:hypothetical protein